MLPVEWQARRSNVSSAHSTLILASVFPLPHAHAHTHAMYTCPNAWRPNSPLRTHTHTLSLSHQGTEDQRRYESNGLRCCTASFPTHGTAPDGTGAAGVSTRQRSPTAPPQVSSSRQGNHAGLQKPWHRAGSCVVIPLPISMPGGRREAD